MSVQLNAAARIAADEDLVELLAEYEGVPAVFALDTDEVPENVATPFVIVDGPAIDEPDDCKVEDGHEITLTIRFYTDADGDVALITEIGERIRALFHRLPDGLAPGAWLAAASGPVVAPTDTSFYGRQVTLRLQTLDA